MRHEPNVFLTPAEQIANVGVQFSFTDREVAWLRPESVQRSGGLFAQFHAHTRRPIPHEIHSQRHVVVDQVQHRVRDGHALLVVHFAIRHCHE